MEEDVEVPKGSSHCFWDLSEVADQPNATQCRPRLKSFPSIDFIRQPDDLVQVCECIPSAKLMDKEFLCMSIQTPAYSMHAGSS